MIKIVTKEEIVKDKKTLPVPVEKTENSGVYFLINEDEIVYVGKSADVHIRVMAHIKEKTKQFDTYSYLLIEDSRERDITECFYIETLNPIYNKARSGSDLLYEVLKVMAELQGYTIRNKYASFE